MGNLRITEWNKASGWVVVYHPDGHWVPAEVTGYRRGKDFTRVEIVSLAVLIDGAVMTTQVFIQDVLELFPEPDPARWISRWTVPDKGTAELVARAANTAVREQPGREAPF